MRNNIISVLSIALLLSSSISLYSQVIDIDVNLNVNHKLGTVTEFDREKFVTIHSDIGGDWDHDYAFTDDLKTDFLEGYNVYMGRNTGGLQWTVNSVALEDPNRAGFCDTVHLASRGASNRSNYASDTEWHPFESRNNLILCNQIHPFYADGSLSNKGWAFSQADTPEEPFGTASGEFYGHYLKNYYGSGGTSGQPFPKFVEVMNEPLWHISDFEGVFKFHNAVAEEVRRINPGALVGGYCTAFPNLEEDNFQRWDNRWKKFMDMSGDYMDFWAIHLYDFPSISGRQKRLRRGSNVEATLDMMEQYSIMSFGEVKPFVITEYGASSHDYFGAWSPYRDHLHNTACNSLMMQFMERSNNIGLTINYTMMKATWGTSDVDNVWGARLLRRADEPVSLTGDWIYSDRVLFYQLWANVKGTRVDTRPYNLDIMADAYVDGSKAYVILNNLAWDEKELIVNLFEEDGRTIDQLMVKDFHLDNSKPVFDDNGTSLDTTVYTASSIPASFTIGAEGTIILEYTFSSDITIPETSLEEKYYATEYYKPIAANTALNFDINGVQKGSYGEAVLRLGIGRNHGKSLRPLVTMNGTELVVPANFRGDTQDDRSSFFGVIEIDVPFDILQEDNTVSITFDDAGGHVSTLTLQAFEFSTDIGRSTGAVTGIYLTPESITIKPGESQQLIEQVTPAMADNRLVIWSSGDTDLATVSDQGVVLAGSTEGTVAIYVTTVDGGFKDSCIVVIKEKEPGWIEVDDPNKYKTTAYISGDSIEVILDYFAGTDETIKTTYGGVQVMFRHLNSSWGVIQDEVFSDESTIGTNTGTAHVMVDLEGVLPSGDLTNGEFYFLFPRFQSTNGESYYVEGLAPITVLADPSPGIRNSGIKRVIVYPNPTSSAISFEVPGLSNFILYMYNAKGQIVFSDFESSGQDIDISSFDAGQYFYTISQRSERYRGSFIIQKRF